MRHLSEIPLKRRVVVWKVLYWTRCMRHNHLPTIYYSTFFPNTKPRVIITTYIRRCFAKRVFENTPYVSLCYIYTMYVCTGLTFYFTSCFSVLSWYLFILMFACVLLLAMYLSEMTNKAVQSINQSIIKVDISEYISNFYPFWEYIPRQQNWLARRWANVGTTVPTLGQRWANRQCCLG